MEKNATEVDRLVQTVRIFSQDIRMEFGLQKYAVVIMKRGKMENCEGVKLPDGGLLKGLEKDESYKYFGVLEADDIKQQELKNSVTKEYFRRVKKILKSKLNGGNTISAINNRAVSVVRYSVGIVKWTVNELNEMDRKTRKRLTKFRALHPQDDVD